MTTTSVTISCSETQFDDGLRMYNWQYLAIVVAAMAIYNWPDVAGNQLFVFRVHNHSDFPMPSSNKPLIHWYSRWHWLMELQSSQCPFVRLLLNALMALPIYNFLLILIGWHLNSSTERNAQKIVLIMQPIAAAKHTCFSAAVLPEVAAPSMSAPCVPPRYKRRVAPKPPPRRRSRIVQNILPDSYPCHKDPFTTLACCCDEDDKFKSLRRNLARVLESLQQPLPPPSIATSSPPALPPITFYNPLDDLIENPVQYSPRKEKSRKWTHSIFKRLAKPFGKNNSSIAPVEVNVSELSSSSGYQSNANAKHFWQRLKLRSKSQRKSQFYVFSSSSSSSSETIGSNTCLYAAC